MWMLFLVSQSQTRNDIAEHHAAKNQVSGHQELFDYGIIFRWYQDASSEKKQSHYDSQEEEYALDKFKENGHNLL